LPSEHLRWLKRWNLAFSHFKIYDLQRAAEISGHLLSKFLIFEYFAY